MQEVSGSNPGGAGLRSTSTIRERRVFPWVFLGIFYFVELVIRSIAVLNTKFSTFSYNLPAKTLKKCTNEKSVKKF